MVYQEDVNLLVRQSVPLGFAVHAAGGVWCSGCNQIGVVAHEVPRLGPAGGCASHVDPGDVDVEGVDECVEEGPVLTSS